MDRLWKGCGRMRIGMGLSKQKIAFTAAGVLLVFYILYHIVGLFGEDMSTIITGVSRENTYLDSDGYIFRNERLLYSNYGGAANYEVGDGEKVSEATLLATVYDGGGDAETLETLRLIDSRIEMLERSVSSGYGVADLPEIKSEMDEAYYALIDRLANRECDDLLKQIDKLKTSMNSFSHISSKDDSAVAAALEELRDAKRSILLNSGAYISEYSSEGGYFYSYSDGLESMFTLSAADTIDGDGFDLLVESSSTGGETEGARSYGKLAENSVWKLGMEIPEEKKIYFDEKGSYEVTFTSNGGVTVPMTLDKMVADSEDGTYILIFSTDRLPEGFVFNRCQNVKICVNSISGIYVPKSAVHRSDGRLCVYVLKGSVVREREIEVLYEERDYYLVDQNGGDDEEAVYLGINELLILNGKNLFDGRILD